MWNIYNLPKEIEEALDKYYLCFDEDWCLIATDEELEIANKEIQELQNKREELIDWFLKDRQNKKAENEWLALEIQRLQARQKRNNDKISFIEKFIDWSFKDTYKKPINYWSFTISYRNSKQTIIEDENLIDNKYKKEVTKTSIIKADIKKAIEAGEKVTGAKIVENLNLTIK